VRKRTVFRTPHLNVTLDISFSRERSTITQSEKQSEEIHCGNEFLHDKIPSMKIGYARVSTYEQNLSLQLDALTKAGCEKLFQDYISGDSTRRAGLDEAMAYVREGDVLVVWRLDRLGRSLKHLIETVSQLEERGIAFQSLQESIDTTTSGGKLIFHIFGALAEFERNLIHERTAAGLEAARTRGRKGGRPKSLDPLKRALLYRLYDEKEHSIQSICKLIGVSKSTLYTYIHERQAKGGT
jgi:DNA invertase Pin-like site-specific DNA recombinase